MKLKIDPLMKCLMLFFLAIGMSNFALAQRSVSGTVTDADNGDPLIGATVLVVGTNTGTTTDIDGSYTVTVPDGSTELEISYTGYSTQRVTLGASNTADVALSPGELLDEVVVVGYGTQRKRDVTGAISTISTKDFNQGIITNPDQLIQGKAAGVQVINNSGAPGGASTVRIRGISSIRSGNDPLYVIDGIPLDGRTAAPGLDSDIGGLPGTNPLTFMNITDIESISILKDASAAAIYGARGANGVILITTKKGNSGEPKVEVNIGAGVSNLLNSYDVLDGNGYRDALSTYNAAAVAAGEDAPFLNDDGSLKGDEGDNVDAMDEILRSGVTQNYNLAFSGGSENGTYRVSLGYQKQEGIVQETGLEKYVGAIRGSFKMLNNKKLTVDYSLTASNVQLQTAPISTNAGFTGNLVGQALQWNPTSPLLDANSPSGYNVLLGSTTINPVALLAAYDDNSSTTNILGWVAPSYQLTDELSYKFTYSVFNGSGIRRASIDRFINVQNVEDRGWAAIANQTLTTQYLSHTLNYKKELGDNTLDAVVGFDYMKFDNKGSFVTARDFEDFGINYFDALQGSSTGSRNIGSFADPSTELQSFFGRLNYSIDGKYHITATVRADGSSKFGENNKYGVFPSFAAAWVISEEDFAPDMFDQLKLRAGWGQTGNQEFPAGASQQRFAITNGGGFVQQEAGNPDLQWETSTTYNVGLDFAFGDYKVVGSIEYFNKTMSDLLFNSSLAAPAPDISIWRNLEGEVVNSGVELGLSAAVVDNDNLTWDVGANVAFISNELQNFGPIVEVGGLFGQGISGATSQRFVNGQPLYVWYTRDHVEIGPDGQSIYEDNEALSYLGDPIPDVLVGINSTLSVGNLDVNIAFNGAYGHTLYNNTANTVIPIGNLGSRNIDAALVDGSGNLEATSNAIKPSDRYIESGNYLKLNNMSIGYTIGDMAGLEGIRISVTGQNLVTFTDYSGFDPEINTVNQNSQGVPSFGLEYIPYPTARTFLFGIGFQF